MTLSDYFRNKMVDLEFRGGSYAAPAAKYLALFVASAGVSPRLAAITTGKTTVPVARNGRSYRCTTAGTTGAGEPAWPTTAGGTVTDGTVVWTETTPDFRANTNLTELAGNGYARQNLAPSAANWASTGGATTTTNPSAGTTGSTSNNSAISFGPNTTADWGVVTHYGIFDASTSGNLSVSDALSAYETVAIGGTATFAISQLAITMNP